MEICKEHSGVAEAIKDMKEDHNRLCIAVEKLTDAIVNLKIQTAKESAKVAAKITLKWGSVIVGVSMAIYKIVEMVTNK